MNPATVTPLRDDPPKEEPKRYAVGNFEIALNLTNARQVKMTGIVYLDDTAKDVNARIDACQDVLDRQSIRADIQNKEAQLANGEQQLEQMRDQYDEMVQRKKKTGKLPSQQQAAVDNYDASVRQIQRSMESLKAAIEAGRKKLEA